MKRGLLLIPKISHPLTMNFAMRKGHADLKVEMGKRLGTWGWTGTVEELMEYWFAGEAEVDTEMAEYIKELRSRE